jgi:hypothetical protein
MDRTLIRISGITLGFFTAYAAITMLDIRDNAQSRLPYKKLSYLIMGSTLGYLINDYIGMKICDCTLGQNCSFKFMF